LGGLRLTGLLDCLVNIADMDVLHLCLHDDLVNSIRTGSRHTLLSSREPQPTLAKVGQARSIKLHQRTSHIQIQTSRRMEHLVY
jgi:hypothetical protein